MSLEPHPSAERLMLAFEPYQDKLILKDCLLSLVKKTSFIALILIFLTSSYLMNFIEFS